MGSLVAVPIAAAVSLISWRPSDFLTLCKFLYTYFHILITRSLTRKRFDLYDVEAHHDPFKVGFLPPPLEAELESPQPDSHLLHAADEIFVYGVNSSSESLVVRITRTVNHEAEAWIFMKLSDGKTYKLRKTSGYQTSCSDSTREFTCGGLKMHYINPMRQWRIFYNGILRQASEEDPTSEKTVYVKFAFIWTASSDLFDMTSDVNSAALALAFAKCKWKSCSPPIEKLQKALNFYAQAGVVHGTVSVDGEFTDHNLYLFGERIRFLGDTFLDTEAQFTHVLGQISKNGSIVHIAIATIPGVVKELKFGFMVLPCGILAPFTDVDMQLENVKAEKNKGINATFHADGLEFKVKGNLTGRVSHFESNKGWDGFLTIDCLNIEMNQLKGSGVLIKGAVLKPSIRSVTDIRSKEIPKDIPFAVHFSEELCELPEITGGKGSSLGKLTQLSKEFQNFIVPNGIVVTTAAFDAFVNNDILKEIRSLEEVLYGKTAGDVKESCQRVMDVVVKTNIPNGVLQAVVKSLQNAFGDHLHTKKFAVRSSATGEDTEQMSAAGQMDTYLGVTGLGEIMSSVKKCWASQYGFIAVQYKRQNGQVVNSPMAVVIQEMVPCDVAGVLFTCDPLTGNPTLMSITANYGLGESVVSGSEEPDTIELTRDEDDKMEIKNKIIGAKSHRIVVRDDAGTSLEEVNENEKNACCLSDAMALRLGNIAVQIEKKYRSHRDIEWGFWNNNLYIFQSRPVTSGTGETDYEIDHERDGPMRIEKEYYSVCNVGEVMPGAFSPLGLDVVLKYFSIPFKRRTTSEWQSRIRPNYFPKGIVRMYNHAMFYAVDLMERIHEGKKLIESTMIGLFGRIVDDEDLYEVARERFTGVKKNWKFIRTFAMVKNLFSGAGLLQKALKQYVDYHLPVDKTKTPQDIFNILTYACDDFNEAMISHMIASQSSSIWNMIILNLIGNARGGINSEAYHDFAKLLISISDVESADVPSAMQSLAYHIGKEITSEELKKMDPEEIDHWLKTSPTEAGIKYRDFLDRHGHRCLKEFDIYSTTWGKNPKLLIKLLQNLVGSISQDFSVKKTEDFDQMLNDLGLSLKFSTRMLLKYLLLPQCRKGVQIRERTKSLLIKLMDEWRKGYWYLAKLMVLEGRIPEEDLLFFMTLEEIQELIDTRSPRIISRAIHRRRRHPILDRYIFPEIMKGFPKPVNADDTPIEPTADDFKMQGIPVSQGVAKGYVRVALDLEEASHLKQGEILVTYSTDIGWTPYFPSLAGVVTELGGLISHGAVVSREYGLPCIAGLHGATRQFKTGDYVLLDGNKGILQKLPPPE